MVVSRVSTCSFVTIQDVLFEDTPFSESDGQYARMAVSADLSMIALYHSSRLIQVGLGFLSVLMAGKVYDFKGCGG